MTTSCALWGHAVDNREFARAAAGARRCRCGTAYLAERGELTRVRHTLSCFLGHHVYQRLIDRDGCHEYVCVQCGHPLLFRADRDPYADRSRFAKKVRYLCGLFGHRVELAAVRDGMAEYACHCGHSFLKPADGASVIRHPLKCVVFGHWIRFVTRRGGFAEYVCVTCGHPFCFADPVAGATGDQSPSTSSRAPTATVGSTAASPGPRGPRGLGSRVRFSQS